MSYFEFGICGFFERYYLSLSSPSTASAQPVNNGEVWITPYGTNVDVITGGGTSVDPYCTPNADLFYKLFHTAGFFSSNVVFHLMPGVFQVEIDPTTHAGITNMSGWKIRGAGMYTTVLQVMTNNPNFSNEGDVIYDDPDIAAVSGVEVSDLTIDCNLQNQIYSLCIGAVGLDAGSDNIISRCRAINWGTLSGAECFVFGVQGRENYSDTGGIVENCIVEQPAPGTGLGTAFSCGSGGANLNPMGGWVIRECSVRNVSTSIHGFTVTGKGVEVYDNTALNLTNGAAFYHDTWNLQDVFVHDNMFLNVGGGVYANDPVCCWTNVAFINNIITYISSGISLDLPAYTNSICIFKGVRIEGNIIKPSNVGANGTPLDLTPVPPSRMEVSCNNNILESGNAATLHSSGDDFQNITFLSYQNNHNLSGTPLSLSDYPVYDYTLTGYYDASLSFSPTNSGWWKLFNCLDWNSPCSARVNIWSVQKGNGVNIDLGVDFQILDNYGVGAGILHQTYNDAQGDWNYIPQVRIAHYSGTDEEGFEIYVNPAMVGSQINLRVSGMNRPPIYPNYALPGPVPSTQTVDSSTVVNVGP